MRIRHREYWLAVVACSAFAPNPAGILHAQTADYFATPWPSAPIQSVNGALLAPKMQPAQPGISSNLYAQTQAAAEPDAPPVLFTFNVGVDEIATDNVGETASDRVSDLSSLFSAGTTVTSQLPRFSGQFSASGLYRRNINDSSQNQFSEYAFGTGHAILVPGAFFFDLAGAADDLSREGGGAQNTLVQSGEDTHTYTLTGSPYLRNDLDRIGINVLRYQMGQVWYGNNTNQLSLPGPDIGAITAATDQIAREDLRMAGTFLPRLMTDISLGGTDEHVSNFSAGNLQTSNSELINEYELTRSIAFIGGGGYEYLHDQAVPIVDGSGAVWDIGGRWKPNPDSSLLLDYGHHYLKSDFAGELTWRLTPLTDIYAQYTDSLTNAQQFQIANIMDSEPGPNGAVSNITYDQSPVISVLDDPSLGSETGEEALAPMGIPLATSANYSPLQNGVFRNKTLSASARSLLNGDPLVLTVYDAQDISLTPQFAPSARSLGSVLSWTTDLSPDISGLALVGFAHQTGAIQASVYNAAIGAGYRLSDSLQLELRYDYIRHDAELSSEGYTQNAVTIGLHKSFD